MGFQPDQKRNVPVNRETEVETNDQRMVLLRDRLPPVQYGLIPVSLTLFLFVLAEIVDTPYNLLHKKSGWKWSLSVVLFVHKMHDKFLIIALWLILDVEYEADLVNGYNVWLLDRLLLLSSVMGMFIKMRVLFDI